MDFCIPITGVKEKIKWEEARQEKVTSWSGEQIASKN